MAKQTIEIEVPDGWKMVGYREPISGEYYLSEVSSSIRAASVSFTSKHIILDRDPDYVEAIEVRLKPGWAARDGDQRIWWHEEKPVYNQAHATWESDGEICRIDDSTNINIGNDPASSLRRVK